jgi:hypothetical protein
MRTQKSIQFGSFVTKKLFFSSNAKNKYVTYNFIFYTEPMWIGWPITAGARSKA